jgi:hypothetical protein
MEVFAIAALLPPGKRYIKSLIHCFAALQIFNHLTTLSSSNNLKMSNSAQPSNSITAEEANQELVNVLRRLEVTVAQALRLQNSPDDAFALDARLNMGVDIAYALVRYCQKFLQCL